MDDCVLIRKRTSSYVVDLTRTTNYKPQTTNLHGAEPNDFGLGAGERPNAGLERPDAGREERREDENEGEGEAEKGVEETGSGTGHGTGGYSKCRMSICC